MERRSLLRAGAAVGAMSIGPTVLRPKSASATHRRAGDPLKLSSNENPLGLSPRARRAVIDGIPDANRYPGASKAVLLEALAEHFNTKRENLVLGAGSSEILQMGVQAFGKRGAKFVMAAPTYEDVPTYAGPWGLTVEQVPLRKNYAHDLERMRQVAESSSEPAVVYICNPNNPTGSLTPSVEVDAWIRTAPSHLTFIVDEAYFEYAQAATEYWSALKWITTHKNVIIARTFSKIYGMAGMRVGFGLAHEETAAHIREMQSKNNVNHLALVAATASLQDHDHITRSLQLNDGGKRVLHGVLDELGLDYLPSYTNFVMHKIHGKLEDYIQRMRDHDMLVGRRFPPMLDYSRVSLAGAEDMKRFASVLRSFREHGWV